MLYFNFIFQSLQRHRIIQSHYLKRYHYLCELQANIKELHPKNNKKRVATEGTAGPSRTVARVTPRVNPTFPFTIKPHPIQ